MAKLSKAEDNRRKTSDLKTRLLDGVLDRITEDPSTINDLSNKEIATLAIQFLPKEKDLDQDLKKAVLDLSEIIAVIPTIEENYNKITALTNSNADLKGKISVLKRTLSEYR